MPAECLYPVDLVEKQTGYTCFLMCAKLIMKSKGQTFAFPEIYKVVETNTKGGVGGIVPAISDAWKQCYTNATLATRTALRAEFKALLKPTVPVYADWVKHWAALDKRRERTLKPTDASVMAANRYTTEAARSFVQDMLLKASGFNKLAVLATDVPKADTMHSTLTTTTAGPLLLQGKLWNSDKLTTRTRSETTGKDIVKTSPNANATEDKTIGAHTVKVKLATPFHATSGHAILVCGMYQEGSVWHYVYRDPNVSNYYLHKASTEFPGAEVWG